MRAFPFLLLHSLAFSSLFSMESLAWGPLAHLSLLKDTMNDPNLGK